MTTIATLVLMAKPTGKPEFELKVEVGTPYFIGGSHEEWACPCSMHPLYSRLVDARGGDAFHALCLAISLLQQLLQCFLEDSGTLKTKDGSDFTLVGYSFGAACRPPRET